MEGDAEIILPTPAAQASSRIIVNFWKIIDLGWRQSNHSYLRDSLLTILLTRNNWQGNCAQLLTAIQGADAHLSTVLHHINAFLMTGKRRIHEIWKRQMGILMHDLLYRPGLLPRTSLSPQVAAQLAWIIAMGEEIYSHIQRFGIYYQVEQQFLLESPTMRDMPKRQYGVLGNLNPGAPRR